MVTRTGHTIFYGGGGGALFNVHPMYIQGKKLNIYDIF
jgi:hypothetical protein